MAALALALLISTSPSFAQEGGTFRPGTLLISPSPSCPPDYLDKLLKDNGCTVKQTLQLRNRKCLVVSTTASLEQVKNSLCDCGHIEAVQYDYKTQASHFQLRHSFFRHRFRRAFFPNDPAYPSQYELRKIRARGAWRNGAKGQGVTVAVLDTGCNPVAELSGKLLTGFNAYLFALNGTIAPGNVDTDPGLGHGTRVATTLAANTNNGLGTASPAFETKIYPVIISDETGEAFDVTFIIGLIKAYEEGIRLVNISFNDTPPNNIANQTNHPVVHQFLQEFHDTGGLVFNASGNDGVATQDPRTRNLIVVSGSDKRDQIWSSSNTGTPLWFAAPAVLTQATDKNGVTSFISGTSASSPLACGVAAQIWSKFPTLTNDQVLDRMVRSARRCIWGYTQEKYGFGIPNGRKATKSVPPWWNYNNDPDDGEDSEEDDDDDDDHD